MLLSSAHSVDGRRLSIWPFVSPVAHRRPSLLWFSSAMRLVCLHCLTALSCSSVPADRMHGMPTSVLREWRRASVEAKRRHRLVLRSVIRLYRAAQLKHFKAWASAANTVGKRERLLDGLFGLMAAQSDVMLRARTLMWWKMWTERAEVERKRLGLAMRQLVSKHFDLYRRDVLCVQVIVIPVFT